MESTPVKTQDAALKPAENEVATVLVHMKKLLRIKNQLCSPLLRLPTEAIIHILSYIMEAVERSHVWQPIFSTCHHIHRIMRTATELWWNVDCRWTRVAHIVFTRSGGNPRVITANLRPWDDEQNEKIRMVLDYWRDEQLFYGHRLRTLELCGEASDATRFSWIFERPLPNLHHLKIRFFGPLANDADGSQLPISSPVALPISMDLPLQTLDLNNVTLPWSSTLFAGLRELHMDFRECETVVEISGDELLGVFDASPQLERLSLVQVRPRIPVSGGEPQYAPTRIAQLPNLAFLKLDNSPESIGYTLVHVGAPAIASLEIRSHVLPPEVPWSLRFFFLNHHLPGRLFPNPPVFEIWLENNGGPSSSMHVTIGGFKIRLDFDTDWEETVCDAIVAHVFPLVPESLAILNLNLDLDEQEWREFLTSHPEVCSIECSNDNDNEEPISEPLWDALSPAGTDADPLCPKLESISLFDNPGFEPFLLDCLLNRKNAGFRLRHLKLGSWDDRFFEEFRLSVEELTVVNAPDNPFDLKIVSLVPMTELCFHVLTRTPSGNTVAVSRSMTESSIVPYPLFPVVGVEPTQ